MDDIIRIQSNTELETLTSVIEDRNSNPDLTWAVAVGSFVEGKSVLRRIGEDSEYKTEIALAETANEKLPSIALARHLTSSYEAAIFDDLRKTSAVCQQIHKEFGRELPGDCLINLAITADSNLAEVANQHPLFKRYVEEVRQWTTDFSDSGSASRQKLLSLCGEAQSAAEFMRRLKASKTDSIQKRIQTVLYPQSANVLLE